MYQLYYYPLNASMAPHFMLKALGIEHELVLVDRKQEAQKSADYLKLNPAGRIPTLLDNGQATFESPAICLHLAERHPEAGLIPPLGDERRPIFHQWLMYLTNTLQAELMIYFYPQRHIGEGMEAQQVVRRQEARLADIWALLDKELGKRSFLVGESITACDYFLFMLAVWSDELPKPPLAYGHLGAYLRKLAKRPEISQACEIENHSLAEYD